MASDSIEADGWRLAAADLSTSRDLAVDLAVDQQHQNRLLSDVERAWSALPAFTRSPESSWLSSRLADKQRRALVTTSTPDLLSHITMVQHFCLVEDLKATH